MANPTLEDALHAARTLREQHATIGSKILLDFLEPLAMMAEAEAVIASDAEGYIVEGALQRGFEMIDGNGDLFVVHTNDLIKYVLEQRAGATSLALQNAAREALPPVKLSINDEAKLGRLVNEFGNVPIFGEGRLRRHVFDDLRKLFGICQAATNKEQS